MISSSPYLGSQVDEKKEQIKILLEFGISLVEREEWQQAIAAFCQVITLDPQCGEGFHNLGLVLKNTGDWEKAEVCFLKATECNSFNLNAWYNLGSLYQKFRRWEDAKACYGQILDVNPFFAGAYNNLGVVLENVYDLAGAEACYRKAANIDPEDPLAHYNLGNLLRVFGRFSEAESSLCRAVEVCPDHYRFTMGLALFYLLIGNYEQGWQKYDEGVRKRCQEKYGTKGEPWYGEDLSGKKILLYDGTGFGDTLQFVRYAEIVAQTAAETSLFVREPLFRLMTESYKEKGITVLTDSARLSDSYDYICSAQRLPIVFQTVEETIPCYPYYLQAIAEDIENWRDFFHRLHDNKNYRVGLVWAGNPNNQMDAFRSVPFERYMPLLDLQGISWFGLQTGDRAADCKAAGGIVMDLSNKLTDFAQTAAVIQNLDLVITMDTSVAHLAGGLGKKTWILLDSYSDWRWQLEREDSPWYPSVRLFRQKQPGDWNEVVERIREELQREALQKG